MSIRARVLTPCVALALLACGACSRPEPPPTDQPPEPQADAAVADAGGESHTQLRDAIQRPIDKAKAVEGVTLEAAERQRAEIDAQTGN
jgi:hypothetical protein